MAMRIDAHLQAREYGDMGYIWTVDRPHKQTEGNEEYEATIK